VRLFAAAEFGLTGREGRENYAKDAKEFK